jgi:lipase maturation factor 1
VPVSAARARVRNVFLRLLGGIFAVAFASLAVQARALWGTTGLLPACPAAGAAGPTLFRFWCDDTALVATAWLGLVPSLGLVLLVAPRWCLVACWALYLSYVNVGQEFLHFQWDNLLLETAFFSLFVAPGRLDGRAAPPPHPAGVFLMQWLLFRLMVESGAAKLATGDPTWRDLTAMASYYETAPLPTWVGWWMHQLPLGAHRASSALTFLVEILLPCFLWAPRPFRRAAVAGMLAFQAFVLLTANYGFFNYLSAALCLWALDDHDLGLREHVLRAASRWRTVALGAIAAILVPISLIPFFPYMRVPPALRELAAPIDRALDPYRSINAYHLFASMTLVRREAVFEGTADGVEWKPYELRWKPGAVDRPPPFVAPHQPRVDFQLWFLFLGNRGARWAGTLLDRMLHDPAAVAPLFVESPFPDEPPSAVRIAVYRYRFSDRATRAATGAWWTRALEGYTRPLRR